MHIIPISFSNNINFQHKYIVNPTNKSLKIVSDKTLGENPTLRLYNDDNTCTEVEMYFYKKSKLSKKVLDNCLGIINYSIFFKDTQKEDLQNGKPYQIDFDKLYNEAQQISASQVQPAYSLKNGEITAKLLYDENEEWHNTDISEITEPTIVIKNAISENENIIANPNVIGIFSYDNFAHTLYHLGTQLRNNTKICGHIHDKTILKQLKSLNGQYIHIKLNDDTIDFKPTTQDTLSEPIKYPKIMPLKLDFCDEILTSNQYKPNLVGPKAYNLHRLETLVKNKKIDVKIPPSIALPYGFTDKMTEYDKEQIDAIIQKLRENNTNETNIMIRSAYNDEDLPNFSAAGIHNSSHMGNTDLVEKSIYNCIKNCLYNSDYTWSYLANYGIKKEDIKPTVILQSTINPDNKFTLYTKYNDKLRIEFESHDVYWGDSYILEYDRKSGKRLNAYKHFTERKYPIEFDENMKPINILEDKKLLKKFDKLAKNALIIEKEFGHPQDIEGGLLNDDIWLWQSRNIVE